MLDEKHIEQQLKQELVELKARARRIEAHRHGEEEAPKDWEELATHRENDEVIDALDDITRDRMSAIEHALARIAEGSWRYCRVCGEAIEEERLRAIPTVDTCIACASKLEQA